MAKIKEVKIGEKSFYIQRMNAFDALKTFGDLQKEILPALSGVMTTDSQVDIKSAITALSTALDGASLEHWSSRLLCNGLVTFDDANDDNVVLKKANFDEAFEDFTGILELIVEVAIENFKDPLVRLLNRSGWDGLSKGSLSELIDKNS
ncbi:phage tail assembly chaperone [Phocoenobacter skyensis]|uniref:Uncharacterized protein n=1 Tax=Phocoenobacter skyensis TaxID=97481 RepID=A0A1H8A4X8_9PAST|nr:hypothetical protein [Pasteurella skyensis]QLB23319.1 hypothetical protein A6B44_08915 [Pasteurella skyensis]SEM65613.1 hypothetical protein SAMN05444853_13710 [Pasteurella skyensis]